MVKNFPTDFWEETQCSLEFIPTSKVPKDIIFTAVKVFLFDKDKILFVKIPRGWDMPTGHKENNESIHETAIREVKEEAEIGINKVAFIGYLKVIQTIQNEKNKKYPPISAIGIFSSCGDFTLFDFTNPSYESTERCFQDMDKVSEIHHRWSPLNEAMMRYAYSCEKKNNKY